MNNFGEKVTFIWSVADLLRDSFKRSKYLDVILPFTVLRRIDCVLEPTKQAVLASHAKRCPVRIDLIRVPPPGWLAVDYGDQP
jgi:type I restriction-modification system DNA methylase subunit